MLHDSTNATDTAASPATATTTQAATAPKLPVGVWQSGRKFAARIRVRSRNAYLGRFDTAEAAIERVAAAASLRDERRAKGEPVTLAELRGLPADGGPDLFAPRSPEEREARREAEQGRMARAWLAKHPEFVRELVARAA